MKIAIISDIHSNLEAFEAVLAEMDKQAPDAVYCLGDIVGYNANPNECVDIIRSRNIPCIMGNHDRVACGLEEPIFFNPAAKQAVLWTRGQLNDENRKYLRELNETISIEGTLLLVHGSPRDPDEYIFTETTAFNCLKYMQNIYRDTKICFFGHTHYKNMFSANRYTPSREAGRTYKFNPEGRYLINPGSVGQPRDKDPSASFIIFDDKMFSITYFPVRYDIKKAAEKVRKEDLPESLAERLYHGS